MKVTRTNLEGCVVIEPDVFGDDRGFFLETFRVSAYAEKAGITKPFLQDNHSRSTKGVLRGLHFQKTKPQGKLVRVVTGEVFDYGPWRFIEYANPNFTAAYFDYNGRYSFGRQPEAALWALTQLRKSLKKFISEKKTIEILTTMKFD